MNYDFHHMQWDEFCTHKHSVYQLLNSDDPDDWAKVDDDYAEALHDLVRRFNRNKSRLVSFLIELAQAGWHQQLSIWRILKVLDAGFRSKNLLLAAVAADIAGREKPLTIRGLMYQLVSAGWLPDTSAKSYNRVVRIMSRLRETGCVPYSWIVDNVRSTLKPPSWSGLTEYVEVVRESYRKDFWASLPEYVHIVCEKDAVSGTLYPVTSEYDVALSPIRGYVSSTFAHEIATQWNAINKPIIAYYLGDFDASGFDLERDIREKLTRYCDRPFEWRRLGVLADDFARFDLLPLPAKKTDRRYKAFVEQHGEDCAEIDAIPATELRKRVREAIESHIPTEQWEQLKRVEQAERETFDKVLRRSGG